MRDRAASLVFCDEALLAVGRQKDRRAYGGDCPECQLNPGQSRALPSDAVRQDPGSAELLGSILELCQRKVARLGPWLANYI